MELMAWSLEGKVGDAILEIDETKYRIKEGEVMITKDADSMSAMRFRMMKAERGFGWT